MRIRWQVLAEEPRCYLCQGWGHQDDEVDHVDGNVTHNDRPNLRRVHRDCHKTKTHGESMRSRGRG